MTEVVKNFFGNERSKTDSTFFTLGIPEKTNHVARSLLCS